MFNMILVKLYKSLIKYYENVCQKIKSGKFFSFSILTDSKKCFPDWKTINCFPYFSRLQRNTATISFIAASQVA